MLHVCCMSSLFAATASGCLASTTDIGPSAGLSLNLLSQTYAHTLIISECRSEARDDLVSNKQMGQPLSVIVSQYQSRYCDNVVGREII